MTMITTKPATTPACPPGALPGGLARTRFFDGMFLTQAYLENEQRYWRIKRRLTNRALGHEDNARFFDHRILCLLFRADKEHVSAACDHVVDHFPCGIPALNGFGKIDDMDAVSRRMDIRRHRGRPAARLVAEVCTGFEKRVQSDLCGGLGRGASGLGALAARFSFSFSSGCRRAPGFITVTLQRRC